MFSGAFQIFSRLQESSWKGTLVQCPEPRFDPLEIPYAPIYNKDSVLLDLITKTHCENILWGQRTIASDWSPRPLKDNVSFGKLFT